MLDPELRSLDHCIDDDLAVAALGVVLETHQTGTIALREINRLPEGLSCRLTLQMGCVDPLEGRSVAAPHGIAAWLRVTKGTQMMILDGLLGQGLPKCGL